MTILKNEPLFQFKEGDYAKPRHLIIEGTDEEIGYDLACLAKSDYGVKPYPYVDPLYGAARNAYFETSWPHLAARAKGARRAYGLPADDTQYDTSSLPYDFYGVKSEVDTSQLTCCSGCILPKEKSADGKGVFVGRNYDMYTLPLYTGFLGGDQPEGAFGYNERSFVTEIRPKVGYKSILIGGLDVMHPVGDGLNEKGLWYAIFSDPAGVVKVAGPTAGEKISGITMIQLGPFLLQTCANVEEAKKKILESRVMMVGLGTHMIFGDKQGKGCIFEIDKISQAYCLTDRKVGEPLVITNHPVSTYTDPDKFPKWEEGAEHNTFNRMCMLHKAISELKTPMKKTDADDMMTLVHCSFLDDKKAQCAPQERTLHTVNCDLSKCELSIKFYLRDVGPIKGTNHMEDVMTEYYTFCFD